MKINGSSWSVYINDLPDGNFLDLQSSVLTGGFAPARSRGDPFEFKNCVSEKFSRKLIKLNSHYRTFDRNVLYMHADPPRGGADECTRSIAQTISDSQRDSIVKFHRLYSDCTDSLYLVDLADARVDKYDLGRLGQKRRMISTAMNEQYWMDGKPFIINSV